MADFVHLHLHSQYSLLDGAILLPKLFPALQERGMEAVALTDHGVMYGILDFYLRAHKAGIKPILGCETYMAKGSRKEKVRDNFHLILLAKNQIGFKNLQYLISMASLTGLYYKPRIDKEILREHSAGLIGLSACLAGEIPRMYFKNGYETAKETALEYADIFEENSFYLELQHNRLEEQDELNEVLIKMSADTGIPLVATNDCHYINREDARAQEILMAVSQRKKLSDKNRLYHEVDEFYLKTPEEMMSAFASVPQAIENTVKIADMCDVKIPNNTMADKPIYFLPDFPTPDNMTQDDYLRLRAKEGLKKRLEELKERNDVSAPLEKYEERLETELDVIISMGFPGYFLIVSDFISWAKDQGIPVGPGRGSGAGSLVAYSLRITDLDPLKFNLLFERFLNPERISMPDFDVDFCRSRRDEVLKYVKEKYGENRVAQISTFSTLKSRAVVRDVGRVMGIPLSVVDKVAKLVPGGKGVDEALEVEPRLKKMYDEDPEIKDLLDMSVKLEGTYRHPGIHAAGVVIGKEDIWNTVPCTKAKSESKSDEDLVIPIVTQYDKDMVETAGLVKFDFLGLDNLTKIDEAVKRINAGLPEGKKFDISKIPMDDENVYAMLARGETGGVFQMESDGFATLLKKLKPDRFEDIIAVVALYRPGPLEGGMVDDYIDCKHGRKDPVYPHPKLETVLSETYGVMVYQEQVMQSARILAGFSLGGADLMRRAMGKKKPEVMQRVKADFIKGCADNGISEEKAVSVFETIEKFAKYGFNKSHSAAYALIGYQTAYLRYHYPVEFIAGILSCERNKPDKVMKYLIIAKKMNITVLSPDINESMEDFTVVKNKAGKKVIRFGIGAIKGVGDTAVKAVIEARGDDSFEGLYDICRRVDLRKVNKSVLEALIKGGALDSLYSEKSNISRPALLKMLEHAIKTGQRYQKEQNSNQMGLFDMLMGDDEPAKPTEPSLLSDIIPMTNIEMLNEERSVLGIYLSGHPLENYLLSGDKDGYGVMREWNSTIGELQDMEADSPRYVRDIKTIGVISKFEEKRQKDSKRRYSTGEIDGMDGVIEYYVGPDKYEELEELIKSQEPFLIEADLRISEISEGNFKRSLYIKNLTGMEANRKGKIKHIQINIDTSMQPLFLRNKNWTEDIAKVINENPGKVSVYVKVTEGNRWETIVKLGKTVKLSNPFTARLSQMFGERNIIYLKTSPKL